MKKAFAEADIYLSPPILKEYRDAPLFLSAEGKIDSVQLQGLISGIASFVANARIVYPQKRIFVCRDPKDNMLLEAAAEAEGHRVGKLVHVQQSLEDRIPFLVRHFI